METHKIEIPEKIIRSCIFKKYLVIQIFAQLLILPSCLLKSKISNDDYTILKIKIIDQDTNEPIPNALAILVAQRPGLGQFEGAYRKEIKD